MQDGCNEGAVFFLAAFLALIFLLLPGSTAAEGIHGFMEFNHSTVASKAVDAAGESAETASDNFSQLFNLGVQKIIYPNLTLNASGTFEKESVKSITDDVETKLTTSNIRPFIDLTLRNPLVTAGMKYNRREERRKGTDLVTGTDVNENYAAIFGWRPAELPSLELRIDRTNTFDKDRLRVDTVGESALLNMRYQPAEIKGLDLEYQPTYRKTESRLEDIVIKTLAHTGRVAYSDSFFKRRVSLYTRYNISYSETETFISRSTGEVSSLIAPFSGLSSIDDTPTTDALALNSALIDGDLTAGSGINIGVPPVGGDTDPRNVGVDFFNETEVNTILIWVDRDLPGQIAGSFSWDIYTSPDNQNWTIHANGVIGSFGTFQNSFEIRFANVNTRYIKVVTKPLDPVSTIGVQGNFDNIFITEIQTFIRKPAETVEEEKTERTSHVYNLDIKTAILERPSLFYEFSYFYTLTEPASIETYTLSNGFSLNHRFNEIFSGAARVAREDTGANDETGVAYRYNASLTAVPLNTLKHTLTYSGNYEDAGGISSVGNSIFLKNAAELYKGIDVDISGGLSFKSQDTGQDSESAIFIFGATLLPHPAVTVNLNYSDSESKESGGDREDSETTNRRTTLGLAYRPFTTLYLVASFEIITTTDDTRDIQNYGITWSPFPDGTLQFNFAYNESLTTDEGKSRLISPSLRWRITRTTNLNLSTQLIETEEESQTSDTVTFNASLRIVF